MIALSPQQALKQETEALCLQCELQYAQFSQFPQLLSGEDWERKQEQLTQQWRGQQMFLQTRYSTPIRLIKSIDYYFDHT